MGVLQRYVENLVDAGKPGVYVKPTRRVVASVAPKKILDARQVWEASYGQAPRGWVLRYIDFDKENLHLSNLVVLPKELDARIRGEMRGGRRYESAELVALYYVSLAKKAAFDRALVEIRADFHKLCREYRAAGLEGPGMMAPASKKY